MMKTVTILILIGCCVASSHAQGRGTVGNPFVKILELESFQNGGNFGHTVLQEDGTASGQKVGPDGLVYGFYTYLQEDGSRVRVNYRAGKGVGYEVLSVEGLSAHNLGNLKPTLPKTPQPSDHQTREQLPVETVHKSVPTQSIQPLSKVVKNPILPGINPFISQEPTPAPHRFDYPANLNVHRTGTGFRSSFKAL